MAEAEEQTSEALRSGCGHCYMHAVTGCDVSMYDAIGACRAAVLERVLFVTVDYNILKFN